MIKLDKVPGNFGVRTHQTSLMQELILQMEMLRTRCWGPLRTQEPHLLWCPACTGQGCGSSRRPSDASSPGLCEKEENTQSSAQKPKQFSFCVNSRLNAISEETTEPCLWNGVWCSYYRILINLWFSAEIYLLKTSQICLTIQDMVTRNNKINPKFTVQTKKTDEGSTPQEVTVRIRKNSAVLEFKKPSFQEASFSPLRCTRAAGKKTVLLDQMNPGITQGSQIWNPGLITSNPLLFPPNRYVSSHYLKINILRKNF